MYNDTPWGYIHQKKKTEEAESKVNGLAVENQILKQIIKKLLNQQSLNDDEKKLISKLK